MSYLIDTFSYLSSGELFQKISNKESGKVGQLCLSVSGNAQPFKIDLLLINLMVPSPSIMFGWRFWSGTSSNFIKLFRGVINSPAQSARPFGPCKHLHLSMISTRNIRQGCKCAP
jgi:hypothetical protein